MCKIGQKRPLLWHMPIGEKRKKRKGRGKKINKYTKASFLLNLKHMLQVRTICPRCLFQPCALLFPLHHQAAISWLTFAPEAKWGITCPKSRAPVFHCIEDPLQALLPWITTCVLT